MVTHRHSKVMEQKKRNQAYLNEDNDDEPPDIQKQGVIYEALPNQLIQSDEQL
jgi:hypothetical protein